MGMSEVQIKALKQAMILPLVDVKAKKGNIAAKAIAIHPIIPALMG